MGFPFLLILLLLHAGIYQANAQQRNTTLHGLVTDADHQPLSGAEVGVSGTSFSARTDAEGKYRMQLPAGYYTITVIAAGYKSAHTQLRLLPDKTLKHNFILKFIHKDLDDIMIVGKSNSRKIKEIGFSMNVLEVSPQINRIMNLSQLVDQSMGLHLRRSGGLGAATELSINGLSGNAVQYFVDGIPMSSMGSGVDLQNLPVNIVDRIEIHKGVVPAELLTDALGGAVNIVTKKNAGNYADISYGIASFGTHQLNLNARIKDKKSGLFLRPNLAINHSKNNYMMRGIELWDETQQAFRPKNVRRFHNAYTSMMAQMDLGIDHQKLADVLMASLSYNRIKDQLQTGSLQDFVYGMAHKRNEGAQFSVTYRKKNMFIPGLSVELYASHTLNHTTLIDTAYRRYSWDGSFVKTEKNEITGRGKSIRHTRRPLSLIRFKTSYSILSGHTLNLNYRFSSLKNNRTDDVDDGFVPGTDRLDRHITSLSYSLLSPDGRWSSNVFAKSYFSRMWVEQKDLDWITKSRDWGGSASSHHMGYGLAARYTFGTPFAAKVSYENAVRLPASRELLGNGYSVYPNFALRPESSHNFNLSAFGDFTFIGKHRLGYEGGFFMRDVKDYIRVVISENEGVAQYDNVDKVRVLGGEAELTYRYADRLDAAINAVYTDERSRTKYYSDGSPQITYNNRLPNTPWLIINGQMGIHFANVLLPQSDLRINYDAHYVHWFYLTWAGYGKLSQKAKIPTQLIHNLSATYSMANGRYNISMGVDNLFDQTAYDNYKLQKPGRSFNCKLRIMIF